jgi:hypothetical protein
LNPNLLKIHVSRNYRMNQKKEQVALSLTLDDIRKAHRGRVEVHMAAARFPRASIAAPAAPPAARSQNPGVAKTASRKKAAAPARGGKKTKATSSKVAARTAR